MTMRPAPGAQIAAGRLRVDATKAIAKLREYQLVDRTAWILEAVRAAVAAGATRIDLQGDSNDVWLSWAGEPWAGEDLPRLFDELVSPEPGAARHHVRLLAAAINSALGANPAYVDVYAIGDDGALRARYTPDVLEAPEGELEESPLRRVQAEVAGVPQGAAKGMHVHFRRRASLEVVSYWLRRADPPELVMARSACADVAVPMRVGDTQLGDIKRDVLRVPLGDDLEGFLALVDTQQSPPHEDEVELAIAERGVRLETTTIELGLAKHAPSPLRVFVDAPRMPTNASRSEVRRDTHPVSTAERRAKELVPQLIAQLVEECRAARDPRMRHAAVHLLASTIGGADWAHRVREIAGPLRALAELPLVRDAAGVPRPIAWPWSGLVHTGSEPYDEALAPWLSGVLWAPPGDPTSAFAASAWLDRKALKDHIRRAKQERRARTAFYKHAPREARVLGRRKPRVRARLGAPLPGSTIPDDVFAGLTGEIFLYRERRGSELIVLHEGREIETVEMDSALSFAAVIDSAFVRPTNRFRACVRDAEYERVERAMRAGLVRAIEAIALAQNGKFVDGYQVAVEGSHVEDEPTIRSGLLLARNLEVPLSPPFEHAQIWRTTDGYRSLVELRAHDVLGVVPRHTRVNPLAGRLIVYADDLERRLLAELVSARIVSYEPGALAERITSSELALEIMGTMPHALAITDHDLVAAIVPADEPVLRLYHRGKRLATWTYTPTLAPCQIAVDCDRIVPDESWSDIADDGALGTRDYAPWERLLAREVAGAILGERSPMLLGGDRVELTGSLGRWLCFSLYVHADPSAVLGDELLARFKMCSLFRVLGEPRAFSIEELAVLFPDTILFVDHATEPVPGMPAVILDVLVARTVAKLAKRKHRNAMEDLVRRRAQLARELRLGMHRALPVQPLEVAGTHVQLASSLGKGVAGVGRDALEVQVLVEGRRFQTITRHDLPLAAVFEITDLSRIDHRFEQLQQGAIEQMLAAVRGKCPELLREIARQFPDALADAGPRRSLLAAFVAKHTLPLDIRDTLARTIKFPTVQGGRATMLDARKGPAIQVCTWTGEWLGAEGPAGDHALDTPILLTAGSPELTTILSALGHIVDVTREVEKLQAQRRIARGLLPTPRVTGADPELTKRLAELGSTYTHLGPGEVALVGGEAEVLLHVNGELRERVTLDCFPAIQLAIEAADLVGDPSQVERRIGPEARALALLLVRRVLLARPAETLPPPIRSSLRRAIIAGALELRDAPVFETITGAWIDLAAVQAQRELFGDLWCVAEIPADTTPLDERRIVLVLSRADQVLASEHGIPVVEAVAELALDARTRRNKLRPLLTTLTDDVAGVIAKIELDGDGISEPRGVVSVLAPNAAIHRRLQLSRALHPFDVAEDPCRWPTIATIDDARFTPDRCWDHPERDDIYKAAIELLHRASNDALRTVVQPPATALTSIRVAPWTYDSVTLLRAGLAQLRGAVWLDGPPLAEVTPQIRVIEAGGERAFTPLRGIGLAGTIYAHAPKGWDREAILEALAKALHTKLVKELVLARKKDPDLVAAHAAWALALERITPADAKTIKFECFRPGPIDAATLHTILMARDPVNVVIPESKYTGSALVDDGSHTARVIKSWLGNRMRSPSQRQRPDTVEPPPPSQVSAHPLQPFIDRLHTRILELGIKVAAWRIVDEREDPIVVYEHDNVLALAANNRFVLDAAGSLLANTAWSADAIDAIAAHCVTVLNVALQAITDATEARAIGKLLS